MGRALLATALALAFTGGLAVTAASSQIYEQKYVVEALITPLNNEIPAISASEVWETIVYRDPARLHTVVRTFGEALHFEFNDDDYFILKRAGTSAGAFDLLRECLAIQSIRDYANAGALTECTIEELPPMVVRVDDVGNIERLRRDEATTSYPEFTVNIRVLPSHQRPSYELVDQFPWIAKLQQYEPSVLPTKIPEEGMFVPSKHYQKDFVEQQ